MEYVIHTPHGEVRTSRQPQLGDNGVLVVQNADGSEIWLSPVAWFRIQTPAGSSGALQSRR
jgi:hypothetical protein